MAAANDPEAFTELPPPRNGTGPVAVGLEITVAFVAWTCPSLICEMTAPETDEDATGVGVAWTWPSEIWEMTAEETTAEVEACTCPSLICEIGAAEETAGAEVLAWTWPSLI